MNPYKLWIAIFGMVFFVPMVPVIYWFLGEYSPGLPAEVRFLAGLVPLATVTIFAVSWWGE